MFLNKLIYIFSWLILFISFIFYFIQLSLFLEGIEHPYLSSLGFTLWAFILLNLIILVYFFRFPFLFQLVFLIWIFEQFWIQYYTFNNFFLSYLFAFFFFFFLGNFFLRSKNLSEFQIHFKDKWKISFNFFLYLFFLGVLVSNIFFFLDKFLELNLSYEKRTIVEFLFYTLCFGVFLIFPFFSLFKKRELQLPFALMNLFFLLFFLIWGTLFVQHETLPYFLEKLYVKDFSFFIKEILFYFDLHRVYRSPFWLYLLFMLIFQIILLLYRRFSKIPFLRLKHLGFFLVHFSIILILTFLFLHFKTSFSGLVYLSNGEKKNKIKSFLFYGKNKIQEQEYTLPFFIRLKDFSKNYWTQKHWITEKKIIQKLPLELKEKSYLNILEEIKKQDFLNPKIFSTAYKKKELPSFQNGFLRILSFFSIDFLLLTRNLETKYFFEDDFLEKNKQELLKIANFYNLFIEEKENKEIVLLKRQKIKESSFSYKVKSYYKRDFIKKQDPIIENLLSEKEKNKLRASLKIINLKDKKSFKKRVSADHPYDEISLNEKNPISIYFFENLSSKEIKKLEEKSKNEKTLLMHFFDPKSKKQEFFSLTELLKDEKYFLSHKVRAFNLDDKTYHSFPFKRDFIEKEDLFLLQIYDDNKKKYQSFLIFKDFFFHKKWNLKEFKRIEKLKKIRFKMIKTNNIFSSVFISVNNKKVYYNQKELKSEKWQEDHLIELKDNLYLYLNTIDKKLENEEEIFLPVKHLPHIINLKEKKDWFDFCKSFYCLSDLEEFFKIFYKEKVLKGNIFFIAKSKIYDDFPFRRKTEKQNPKIFTYWKKMNFQKRSFFLLEIDLFKDEKFFQKIILHHKKNFYQIDKNNILEVNKKAGNSIKNWSIKLSIDEEDKKGGDKNFEISLNKPFFYKGYEFYQYAYDEEKQKIALLIKKTKWRKMIFLSFGLFILGLLFLFFKKK